MWLRSVAFGLAAGVLAAPAMAADVVRPPPVVAPVVAAPIDYFSGFYAGLHGGYGWSDATSQYVDSWANPPTCGVNYYWGCPVDVDPKGEFVGGQIGVNHVLGGGTADWYSGRLLRRESRG
jgi:outer membrane immunogenic protein